MSMVMDEKIREIAEQKTCAVRDGMWQMFREGVEEGLRPFEDLACWLTAEPSMSHAELLKYTIVRINEVRTQFRLPEKDYTYLTKPQSWD